VSSSVSNIIISEMRQAVPSDKLFPLNRGSEGAASFTSTPYPTPLPTLLAQAMSQISFPPITADEEGMPAVTSLSYNTLPAFVVYFATFRGHCRRTAQ
jgi:hypothetical protein